MPNYRVSKAHTAAFCSIAAELSEPGAVIATVTGRISAVVKGNEVGKRLDDPEGLRAWIAAGWLTLSNSPDARVRRYAATPDSLRMAGAMNGEKYQEPSCKKRTLKGLLTI